MHAGHPYQQFAVNPVNPVNPFSPYKPYKNLVNPTSRGIGSQGLPGLDVYRLSKDFQFADDTMASVAPNSLNVHRVHGVPEGSIRFHRVT